MALQSRLPPRGRDGRGGAVRRDGSPRSTGLPHMPFDVSTLLYTASIWVLPAVTAITLHEAAHGWVAEKLGDDTARRLGRVSFNP